MLLEKFKDKAAMVTRAAAEALTMMHRYCFTLGDVAEDIAAALAHQNPKVRTRRAWVCCALCLALRRDVRCGREDNSRAWAAALAV